MFGRFEQHLVRYCVHGLALGEGGLVSGIICASCHRKRTDVRRVLPASPCCGSRTGLPKPQTSKNLRVQGRPHSQPRSRPQNDPKTTPKRNDPKSKTTPKRPQNDPKTTPKRPRNDPTVDPKSTPKRPQNDPSKLARVTFGVFWGVKEVGFWMVSFSPSLLP